MLVNKRNQFNSFSVYELNIQQEDLQKPTKKIHTIVQIMVNVACAE